ncbi:MAG: MurR/RpiR family transcriptional regulator [Bacilli bacterium]
MFNEDKISDMNPTEYALYTFINDHYERVISMSIRDLAEETHVSTATISRFCKKFDCEGYSEFKVRLKMHYEKELQKSRQHVYEDRSRWTQFFLRMDDGDFHKKIERAVEIMQERQKTIIIGFGNSAHIAAYGANYMMTFDRLSFAITDAYAPIPNASHLEEYVVIVLSVSGETKTALKMVQNYQRSGAFVIAITNSSESTLAKISDLVLPYYIQEEYMVDFPHNITSQIPAVYILETLVRRYNNATLKGHSKT